MTLLVTIVTGFFDRILHLPFTQSLAKVCAERRDNIMIRIYFIIKNPFVKVVNSPIWFILLEGILIVNDVRYLESGLE